MKTVPNRHRQESLKINIFQKNQGLSEVSVRDFPGACAGKRPLTDTAKKFREKGGFEVSVSEPTSLWVKTILRPQRKP